MAKRFIDTDIFRKPLVRGMKAPYKALFIYLLCECDHAGVWDAEIDIASMRLGMRLDESKALEELQGAAVSIGGGKWWLPDFVEFQYGELNPANRVHASVLSRLSKLGLDPEKIRGNEGANKGLTSPLQGAKDKDKDKDKDNSSGKERAGVNAADLPFTSPAFAAAWQTWETSRRERRKPITPTARRLQLAKCAEWGEARAIAALTHSASNDWQGLFEPPAARQDPTAARKSTVMDRNAPIETNLKSNR